MTYSSSAADRLVAVRAAIDRCLVTQEYTVRGRMQRMASLKDLRALEVELMDEVNASSNSGAMCEVLEVENPR